MWLPLYDFSLLFRAKMTNKIPSKGNLASAICPHILAAMYSIDCEMFSKKKGNITATQRKARQTKQRYRSSGKKPPSRIEKNSSAVCWERDLNNKKRKALAEMLNCTPESPDTSELMRIWAMSIRNQKNWNLKMPLNISSSISRIIHRVPKRS